jgi:DNA mismatch endonuclease, patch repair protein
MPDNLTPAQRSKTMSRIRSKNTQPELLLRGALHKRGIRFRLYSKNLPGSPDLVLSASHLVIFVDGDFWHGYRLRTFIKKLSPYWRRKLSGNRRRDRVVDEKLKSLGWKVMRIWEHDIRADLESALDRIVKRMGRSSFAAS